MPSANQPRTTLHLGFADKRGRARVATTLAAAAIQALIFAATASADLPNPPAAAAPAAEPAASKPDDSPPPTLLGDMGGLRPAIAPYGVTFHLIETSEILGNFTGGVGRGAIYEGRTDANLLLDLRTAYKWPGVFSARAYQIHGRGLTAGNLLNLNAASGNEAVPATRLFELWYEHYLNDSLRIRIGQQGADQEFAISTNSAFFINGTFGWPTLPATALPSGGPAYPLATPAVRVRFDPTDELAMLAAVFNGDPAGPGPGSPQVRNPSGTSFRIDDGVLAMFEAQYDPGHSKQNGTYRLGAWFHSERFADQRFDTSGLSLADPLSTGSPRMLGNDYSIYGIVDQPLFREKDADAGLSAFLRMIGAPGDRNLVDFYFDTGLVYKGPFGRGDDSVGIGFGYARIGDSARGLDKDTARFTGQPYPTRSGEAVLEVSYQAAVTPWSQLQPDFQYIFNPAGGVPNPVAPGRRIGSAAILGLRTVITF
jgi:porin